MGKIIRFTNNFIINIKGVIKFSLPQAQTVLSPIYSHLKSNS